MINKDLKGDFDRSFLSEVEIDKRRISLNYIIYQQREPKKKHEDLIISWTIVTNEIMFSRRRKKTQINDILFTT